MLYFCSVHFSANNAKINFREKEKKVLDQILGQGKYDARIRPSGINGTGECVKCYKNLIEKKKKEKNTKYFDDVMVQVNCN